MTFVHVVDGDLKTPESIVQTAAWDQRFGRRFFFKAAYLHRHGSHAYIIDPDASRGVLTLSSTGASAILGSSRPRAAISPANTAT